MKTNQTLGLEIRAGEQGQLSQPQTGRQGWKLALAVVCLTVGLAGCKPVDETSPQSTAPLDQPRTQVRETVPGMRDYTFAQRDEYVVAMQAQLAEINRELDQLSARVDQAGADAKAEASPRIQALREQAAKLNTQLDRAKGSTESGWEDVKAGFKKGYADLKDGFQQARQWTSDKIAP